MKLRGFRRANKPRCGLFSRHYDSQFRFMVGDHAEYITGRGLLSGHLYTDGCTIIHRGFNQYRQPCYIAQGIQAAVLDGCWIDETRFE